MSLPVRMPDEKERVRIMRIVRTSIVLGAVLITLGTQAGAADNVGKGAEKPAVKTEGKSAEKSAEKPAGKKPGAAADGGASAQVADPPSA